VLARDGLLGPVMREVEQSTFERPCDELE
jgi:hypothetical protein